LVKFQPRTGQTPSQATISKLSTATGAYTIGTLRQGGNGRAPDGGAIVDYPKGWRFLPVPHNSEAGEILKKSVAGALRGLSNLQGSPTWGVDNKSGSSYERDQRIAKYQKEIDDAHYNLVIAPQIKAEKEQKEREEEEQRQTIATLKMRVQELTKKPIEVSTAPAVTTSATSYLPLAVVGIVIVVILLILRRRA